jgi:hypothetical protein
VHALVATAAMNPISWGYTSIVIATVMVRSRKEFASFEGTLCASVS